MPIFFDDTQSLLRILITAPILYGAIIGFVRLAGKRSTSQMNNFDWIVTVALGSIIGSGILLQDVAIADVLLAVTLLMGLQYCLTSLAVRFEFFDGLVKAKPRLLVADGECIADAMRRERVTEQELRSALRQNGLNDTGQARWVILESDASFSVIPYAGESGADEQSALHSVAGFNRAGA